MLPYSRGHDLDVLGSLLAVKRLVVGTDSKGRAILEDDERFRRRIQLAPEAFSVAGPRGAYIFWALTLAATIPDASLYLTAPGQLQLTLLGAATSGLPTDDELLKVREGFKLKHLTPLTDYLVVSKPVVVPYTLRADVWLFPGPDAATVQKAISDGVDKFLADNRRLGRDHPRSGLIAAIQQPGVSRVNLITPAEDILVDERRIVLPLGGIDLRLAGRSE
jgi:phage-related baseplate assembly protein